MAILAHTTEFVVIHCYKCNVPFGLSKELYDRRRKDHDSFWCPNGHSQVFTGDTEEKRLKQELARVKNSLSYAEENARRARQDAEHFQHKANGYKGQLALVKKRVANGICPCCNRYFENLHRHMQSKHQDFLEESGIVAAMDASTPEAFDQAIEKIVEGLADSSAQQYRSVASKLKRVLFPEEPKS